jgi:hypothetical protein
VTRAKDFFVQNWIELVALRGDRMKIEDAGLAVADLDQALAVPIEAGTAMVEGFGVAVRVRHGSLEIVDGYGPRRTRRFNRVAHPDTQLQCLVINTRDGYITFDALDWCRQAGVEVTGVDHQGSGWWTATPLHPGITSTHRARRVQAAVGLTDDDPIAVAVAAWIIDRKLAGQAQVAWQTLAAYDTADLISGYRREVKAADQLKEVKQVEAKAAIAYFKAWKHAGAPVFTPAAAEKVPGLWQKWQGRSVGGKVLNNRKATHPTGDTGSPPRPPPWPPPPPASTRTWASSTTTPDGGPVSPVT